MAHSVAGDGLPRVAREAVKTGIGWVLLNRDVPYIDSLRQEYSQLPISIVSTDQMNIGRTEGSQFRSLLQARPRSGERYVDRCVGDR